MKFDRYINRAAAETSVKVQSDQEMLKINLRAFETLQDLMIRFLILEVLSDIETIPWKIFCQVYFSAPYIN